jgi:flagellar basal-body rod protein FlgB
MSSDLFGPTYSLLSKVLDLRSQRHNLISSNIANADTPGYKAGHIAFEDELNKMMPSGSRLRLAATNENHMPRALDLSKLQPEVVQESSAEQRIDGNTVNIEKETIDLSKNQLMYGAVTQILRKKFEALHSSIQGIK